MRVEFDGEIHEFPDDFTDEEVRAALVGSPKDMTDVSGVPGLPARGLRGMPRFSGPQEIDPIAPPSESSQYAAGLGLAGGLAGSLLGPVGSVAGMGLGAYAGKRMDLSHAGIPDNGQSTNEALKQMSLAGFGEVAAPVVGALVAPAMKTGIARRIAGAAWNPGKKLLTRSPRLMEKTLQEGIGIGRGQSMTGASRLERRLLRSISAENDLANASPAVRRWDPQEILQKARDIINSSRTKNQTKLRSDNPEWQAMEQEFLGRFKQPDVPGVPQLPAGPGPKGGNFEPGTHDLPIARGRPIGANQLSAERLALAGGVRGAAQRARVPESLPTSGGYGEFDLEDLLTLRREFDEKALKPHNIREGKKLGSSSSAQADLEDKFNKAIADVVRGEIRAADATVGGQSEKTASLLARKIAMVQAEARPEKISVTNPISALVSLAGGPSRASRLALRLYSSGSRPPSNLARFAPAFTRFGPKALPMVLPDNER